MDGFKGSSHDQNIRFKDKEKKLLKSMAFPENFNQKVDMRKVELSVFKPWIAQKISKDFGLDDDVLIEYVTGLLEDEANPIIDPKKMQINLTGFLEKRTPAFMEELWRLLLSAQASPVKVPAEFIEQKKLEMRQKQEQDERAVAKRTQETDAIQQSQSKMDEIRSRERNNRQGPHSFEGSSRPSRPNDQRPRDRNRGSRYDREDRDRDYDRDSRRQPRRRFESPPRDQRRRDRSRSPSRTPPSAKRRSYRAEQDRRGRSKSRSPVNERYQSRSRSRSRSPYERKQSRRDGSRERRRRSISGERRSDRRQRSRSHSYSDDERYKSHKSHNRRNDSPPPSKKRRSVSPEDHRRSTNDQRRRAPSFTPTPPPDAVPSRDRDSKTPEYREETPPESAQSRETDLKERLLKDRLAKRNGHS